MNMKDMKCRFIVNPFFWFTLVWSLILSIHTLNILEIYPAVPTQVFVFMIGVLLSSIFFGSIYHSFFLEDKRQVVLDNDKPNWIWIIACLVGFLLEVLYSRMIPIIEVFRGNTSSYQEFGIPHLTFVIVSMTIALTGISSVKLFYGNEYKAIHISTILMCLLIFLLSYSRGILIFAFLIVLAVFLTKIRFSLTTIVFLLILGGIGALLFNMAGNIRQNAPINDSSYIMNIAGFKKEYQFLSPFSWVITYVDTPLGNLCYNYVNVKPLYDLKGLISQLIPDFISKRIYPDYNSYLVLVQPGLTASSMFAGGYKYYGLIGMLLSYIELVAFIFVVTLFTRKNTKVFLSASASLSIMAAMTFFDNMVTYSGYSFFLIFYVIYRFFAHDDTEYVLSQRVIDFIIFSDGYEELQA